MKKLNNLNDTLSVAIADDIVGIGNIIKASPEIHRRANLEQARNKFTMTAEISQEDVLRIQQLSAPLKRADEMAAQLNDMQQLWKDKIKYMDRRTRRAYKRHARELAKQFKAYCSMHGITYTYKNINDESN